MTHQFHALKVGRKIQETEDTISLLFDVPPALNDEFKYLAGQYLTLKFKIGEKEARRAYSMSSSPLEEGIKVTIKKVAGGLVSNHIHVNVNENDTVDVMPPQGRFVPDIKEENRKVYYLFGAGSGITPLMSILKTLLEEEPQSTVFLYYGSRNENQIIFKEELDNLSRKYTGQLNVTHIISQPSKIKAGGIAGVLGKKKSLWLGQRGRIDRRTVAQYLEQNIPPYPNTEYFICGPGNMIQTVKDVLIARGVGDSSVHFEMFNSELPGDGARTVTESNSGENARGWEVGSWKSMFLRGKRLWIYY